VVWAAVSTVSAWYFDLSAVIGRLDSMATWMSTFEQLI